MFRKATPVCLFVFVAGLGLAQTTPPTTATYQSSGGMIGFLSLSAGATPAQFSSGLSFYSTAWQMLDAPIDNFQSGLAGTWIKPNNSDFTQALCGKGTMAGDNWPERGPTYRDVFQTIEGGLGWWGSLQNRTAQPKFGINTTSDCYTGYVASVGWGYGATRTLACDKMGLVILSNRLLYPPDLLTLRPGTDGQLFGYAWMALPFIAPRENDGAATGENSWTLFLNTRNFKGPLAFLAPNLYSDLSRRFPAITGRGLDTRPADTGSLAMEVNTVPRYRAVAADGTIYQRVPRIKMPAVTGGRSVLAQDVTKYSQDALFKGMKDWMQGKGPMPSGEFNAAGGFAPRCTSSAPGLRSEPENNAPLQLGGIMQPESGFAGCSYGFRWVAGSGFPAGELPQYYRKDRAANNQFVMTPVQAAEVPAPLRLAEQTFPERKGVGAPFTVASSLKGCWVSPGPAAGPFVALLEDGSEVTYFWYRFVDQPALQRLNLSDEEKAALQAKVEAIHAGWPIDGKYMADPSPGSPGLAALDENALVTPPAGFEYGYVPIVTAQRRIVVGEIRERAPRVAAAGSVLKISAEIVSLTGATARIGGDFLKIVQLTNREAQVLIPETQAPGPVEVVLYTGAKELTFPVEIRKVAPFLNGAKSAVEVTEANGQTRTVSGNCVPVAECEPLAIPALEPGASVRLKLRGTGFRNADLAKMRVRVGWSEYPVESVAAVDGDGLDEAAFVLDKLPAGYGVVDVALLTEPGAVVDPSEAAQVTLPGTGPKGARISLARAFAAGRAGAWYFVDTPTRTVKRVSATGEVTDIYTATADVANGMAVDSQERIYLVAGGRVLRISADGQKVDTLYAGGGLSPWGIALHEESGFLYCANVNRISRIDLAKGTMEHIAGTGVAGAGVEGVAATQSPIQFAASLAVAADGSAVLYTDSNDRKVRRIDLKSGIVRTVAGNGAAGNSPDGTLATQATVTTPQGVAFDTDGGVLFTQLNPSLVRRVEADGRLQTAINGGGGIFAIAVDSLGYLFAMDIGRNEVVRLPPSRTAKTVVAAP